MNKICNIRLNLSYVQAITVDVVSLLNIVHYVQNIQYQAFLFRLLQLIWFHWWMLFKYPRWVKRKFSHCHGNVSITSDHGILVSENHCFWFTSLYFLELRYFKAVIIYWIFPFLSQKYQSKHITSWFSKF